MIETSPVTAKAIEGLTALTEQGHKDLEDTFECLGRGTLARLVAPEDYARLTATSWGLTCLFEDGYEEVARLLVDYPVEATAYLQSMIRLLKKLCELFSIMDTQRFPDSPHHAAHLDLIRRELQKLLLPVPSNEGPDVILT